LRPFVETRDRVALRKDSLIVSDREDGAMLDTLAPNHGVTEGQGAYNRHATAQAAGCSLAVPLMIQAASETGIDLGVHPVVIADYGSSQGKNSLTPIRATINVLKSRIGSARAINVIHTDLPANDFNTLFQVLDSDPDSYILNHPNVFPFAIGRSFYRSVFPADSVHIGWSAYAAVWLSRLPAAISDHFVAFRSNGPERALFDRQAAQDWEAFLSLRAAELRRGGRLVVVLPGLDEDGASELDSLLDQANSVLLELVNERAITSKEYRGMTLAAYPRRQRDLLLPFQHVERFRGLIVKDCDMQVVADGAWAHYQQSNDGKALACAHASLFRATFMPSLAAALAPSRSIEERRVFSDRLEDGLKCRLAEHPAPLHRHVQTIVLAK
jgi:hypothetical protein